MKNVLFVLAMVLGTITTAQNYIGYSVAYVEQALEAEGHIVNYVDVDEPEEAGLYIQQYNSYTIYFFWENFCYQYLTTWEPLVREEQISQLLSEYFPYDKKSKKWVDEEGGRVISIHRNSDETISVLSTAFGWEK